MQACLMLTPALQGVAVAADKPLAFKGLALGSTEQEVLKHYL